MPKMRYKDHSIAYLAGKPPTAKGMLLPEDAAAVAQQEDSD